MDIKKTPDYDGGKIIIERLLGVYSLDSRLQLADELGLTSATISTWQARNTVPYEILIRTHLRKGVSMEFLCFGKENCHSEEKSEIHKRQELEPEKSPSMPSLVTKSIDDGSLKVIEKIPTDIQTFKLYKIEPYTKDFAIKYKGKILFINARNTTVSSGTYLFSTKGIYRIGLLRLMPDGEIYFIEDGKRFVINSEITKIHGKVTTAIENL